MKDRVLQLTKKIPKGKITTYKIIADKLNSKAYRAIGQILKNNKNKNIPCYRVILNNGNVGGYKGIKDNKKKIKLLRNEGIKIKNNKIINFKNYLFRF